MRRVSVILLLGHILGSYGIEGCDAVDNYELEVPIGERLTAPVHALPWLVRTTAKTPSKQLVHFWFGYTFGWSLAIAVGIVAWRGRSARRSRGFDLSDPSDAPR
jgi:hypothetical protein